MHPPVFTTRRLADDVGLIGTHLPVPGLGILPCNAFVIRAREPVLVDTGVAAARASFLEALQVELDPADLRWIWITHMDPDHIGNLAEVLALAPRARVVTNFLGMGKMGLLGLPQDRAYLVNPGQSVSVGDRRLRALRPPVFDAPETMALFDDRAGVLYSSDCFGAVLPAPAESAEQLGAALRDGLITWTCVDAPWLALANAQRIGKACQELSRFGPERVLGSHLPPARGAALPGLIDHLMEACNAPAFEGPDQAQLEAAQALPQAA